VHPHADLVLPEPEHDAGAMAPAGQLWITAADLARWSAFLAGDTAGLLSAATLAEMREPIAVDDMPGEPWTAAYGLGLQLWNSGGRRTYGHTGSMPGFVAVLMVAADTSDAAVALCNSTAGFGRSLAPDLLRILADAEPAPPASWQPAAVPPDVADMLGTWYWGPAECTLRTGSAGILELKFSGTGPSSRFRPGEDGTWVGLDGYHGGEPLRRVIDADGSVLALNLGSFVYTRAPYDPRAPVPGGVDPGGWRGRADSD
jgi:hypothetical protein